jgi:hypothetical protein
MTFTKSKISIDFLFVFAITTMWIITPTYACGIKFASKSVQTSTNWFALTL